MGWKGTVRSIQAAQRRAEREAQRQRRDLERQRKHIEKMEELERAAFEVQEYENYIDLLMSTQKECGDVIDWKGIQSLEAPTKPKKSHNLEQQAQSNVDNYKPGVFDKLLKRTETKHNNLLKAVEEARKADKDEYQRALEKYKQENADWEAACELADKILDGNSNAYIAAIKWADPFSDISELGTSIEFKVGENSIFEAILHVNNEQVIPSEVKSLLKSGKLSVKRMPKGHFYELYQDYVCGSVLRVARELFALLPIEMVVVTALGNLLNSQTGHLEEQPILSVAIPKKTLETLNFDMLDPSDSMSNFVHQMKFQKTKGFSSVETLNPSDFQAT